jgi:Ser-tRNA(Ala) deacylase AlaX
MGLSLVALDALIADVSFANLKPSTPPAAPAAPKATKPAVAVAKAAAAPQAKNAAKAATTPAATPAAAQPAAKPAVAEAAVPSGIPPTDALYQTDTYLFTCDATVLAITPLEGEAGGWAVMLDATCFHPQGGGQPADTGAISTADGAATFAVKMVKKDPQGVVRHEGPGAPPPAMAVGTRVRCVVDEGPRVYNARVHSAGHLIDVAMSQANLANLRPTKGYHFVPGAYVEYDGKVDAATREALVPKLQASMDALIEESIPTKVAQVEAQKLDEACPPSALPPDRAQWGSGWVRVVTVGGQGCPCGGTHVRDTKELGRVRVEAVKVKGKVTRVSYTLEQ